MSEFNGQISSFGRAGSTNDRKRIPGFDDYKAMSDAIAKYGDDLRMYFATAQTHDDLRRAKEELEADEQTNFPDKIVSYFYDERKRALGPKTIKDKEDSSFDDSEIALNQKIDATKKHQQDSQTEYRPTWN